MFAGYSAATPSLWALAGYESMVLRFEGNDTLREQWRRDRAFEFVWQVRRTPLAAHWDGLRVGDVGTRSVRTSARAILAIASLDTHRTDFGQASASLPVANQTILASVIDGNYCE